jgi:hypothetical protein
MRLRDDSSTDWTHGEVNVRCDMRCEFTRPDVAARGPTCSADRRHTIATSDLPPYSHAELQRSVLPRQAG